MKEMTNGKKEASTLKDDFDQIVFNFANIETIIKNLEEELKPFLKTLTYAQGSIESDETDTNHSPNRETFRAINRRLESILNNLTDLTNKIDK